MFLLATADFGITLFLYFRIISSFGKNVVRYKLLDYKFVLFITTNVISGGLFVKRSYKLWQNVWVAVVPGVLLLGATVVGYASMTTNAQAAGQLFEVLYITLTISSILVTLLIMVRVLYITRKAREISGLKGQAKYLTFVMCVESGAVYSIFIFLYLVLHPLMIQTSLTQLAGITATLMTYQVSRQRDVLGDITTPTSFNVHGYPSALRSVAPIRTTVALDLRRTETNDTQPSNKIYT